MGTGEGNGEAQVSTMDGPTPDGEGADLIRVPESRQRSHGDCHDGDGDGT